MITVPGPIGLADEGQTAELAARFGKRIRPPFVLYLQGELGAGKTTFARALIRALGYPGRVKSPTFGLLETYSAGGLQILHLDLYRIAKPVELEFLAIRDLFGPDSLLLVEWPENGAGFIPQPDMSLELEMDGAGRRAVVRPFSESGKALADAVLGGK